MRLVLINGVAYQLKRSESVSRGIRRLARKTLGSALERLSPGDPAQRDEAVHEGRKDIKKTRALLELVRPELGHQYKKSKQRLRQAARPLSLERDAKVLLETLEDLRKGHDRKLPERTWAALRHALERPAIDATRRALRPASVTRTIDALSSVRDDSRSWSLDEHGFGGLRPGLKRSYTRARKAFRRAQAHQTPPNLHEWRKRVKAHWYQMRLIESVDARRLTAYISRLHDIERWLGDHHNLTVLITRVEAATLPGSMLRHLARLRTLIERRQLLLQRRAIALGERVYAERAGAFVKRLGRAWHAWRKEAA